MQKVKKILQGLGSMIKRMMFIGYVHVNLFEEWKNQSLFCPLR